jgi:AcrR family transcriptional regulator
MRKRTATTRIAIIAAAQKLFLSKGYIATTIDAVAEDAGVTKRTVYGYFSDKRTLFKGVIENAIGDPWDPSIPFREIETVQELRKTLYVISLGIDKIVGQPEYIQLLRVTIAEIPSQPELYILVERGIICRALTALVQVFTTAKKRALLEIDDPEVAASQFMGGFVARILLGGLMQATTEYTRHQPPRELREYVDEFLGRTSGLS